MTVNLAEIPGQVPGNGHADWPEWCTTFNERKAYQQGIAHARCIAFTHIPREPNRSPFLPSDPNVSFGGDGFWRSNFSVSRSPKKTVAKFRIDLANAYVFEDLNADELEELARVFIDAAHHLRTQPDF
ncbi:hypothetical protein [Limnohabitans sp. T6-5]|uniref:hypothetical protein n=1 Tax=Limnohabitans sp. T6-5 TaxID=1100724 RepID=UPI0011B1EA1A|nr:hypothetical protein [Limnohabitans sp. T6-5]